MRARLLSGFFLLLSAAYCAETVRPDKPVQSAAEPTPPDDLGNVTLPEITEDPQLLVCVFEKSKQRLSCLDFKEFLRMKRRTDGALRGSVKPAPAPEFY